MAALAPPVLSWQPRLPTAGQGHREPSVQRPLRNARLAYAAPAALILFLPRRHSRQSRAFRSQRRGFGEAGTGPSLTATLQELPILKEVRLPYLKAWL
eukprot:s638_g17.t1